MIQLPIEIGDTILAGRFKNKKIVVKEIGTDQYGLPTVNGRGILKIRIEKLIDKDKKMSKANESIVNKLFEAKSKYSKQFVDKVLELCFTDFNNLRMREDKLQHLFQQNNIPYDRETVKNIAYNHYKSRGGYKSKEYVTDFIFGESKVSNKKLVREQSEEKTFDFGRSIPVKIKKDGDRYCIYRVNQPDGSETKALNNGFETEDLAERAARLRGFVLIDDKGNVKGYESDKQPTKLKTTKEKVEYVTEIVRRLVRESKVSKKKIIKESLDPKIDKAINELAELEKQLAAATAKIDALKKELDVSGMEKRYKQIVDSELWDFLEQMKKDEERVTRASNVLLTIKRYQTEKATYEYEQVLDFAMTQVNQDVKEKILMELKATEKISRVKPSLSFSKAEGKITEANVFTKIVDWMKSFFTGLNAKLRSKGQNIDKNLEKLERALKIQGQ